jgi:hypothetical protein
LEEKLSNKFKNVNDQLRSSLNFMVFGYPSKNSQNHGNPYAWKFFITILEFFWQFFFQNDVFKLQEDFSELGIIVFLENGLGSFQTFLILQIWDKPEVLKRFQKQFWKLESKPKKSPGSFHANSTRPWHPWSRIGRIIFYS